MPGPQRTHRTTGPEDQQYRRPLPGPPRTRQVRPRTRPHSRRPRPGPVLPQGPRRPPAGPQRRGGNGNPAWHRPGTRGRQQALAAGKPVSRRALRSEGIKGSNQALDALRARSTPSWRAQQLSRPDPATPWCEPDPAGAPFSSQPRPVASFSPMPPAGHDRLPGGNLAGMVAYVSHEGLDGAFAVAGGLSDTGLKQNFPAPCPGDPHNCELLLSSPGATEGYGRGLADLGPTTRICPVAVRG